jgi:hypothetical protein
VSVSTIRRAITAGELTAVCPAPSTRRLMIDDLRRWLESKRLAGGAEESADDSAVERIDQSPESAA